MLKFKYSIDNLYAYGFIKSALLQQLRKQQQGAKSWGTKYGRLEDSEEDNKGAGYGAQEEDTGSDKSAADASSIMQLESIQITIAIHLRQFTELRLDIISALSTQQDCKPPLLNFSVFCIHTTKTSSNLLPSSAVVVPPPALQTPAKQNQGQPGLLVLQVRRLDLHTPATTFVKLIARADILALPPIFSINFVQRFFAYHVAAALVLLFEHNMHPLPDSLLARTRRLKLCLDTPWETLQATFLKAAWFALTAKYDGAAAASFSLLEGDGEEKKIFNKIAKIFICPHSSTWLLALFWSVVKGSYALKRLAKS
ncbi:hypothetical protein PtA15_12A107 [Puccinia triticina]|uniref:Uncharacterized protein n=1 Tax=Puccinia triticina TaxID=208348 RepID=A0ABY7D1I4_9BASI|nr:uncharacterized protein PtA15_12A107 [Puccinia triticina]WAQ90122.1 hypothetical protein PtA15_12A107 [Puccinia triticina]